MFAPKVVRPQAKVATDSSNGLAHQRLSRRPGHSSVELPLFLQRNIGNQATLLPRQSLVSIGRTVGGRHAKEGIQGNMTAQETSRGASWEFSNIPIFPAARPTQAQSTFAASSLPGIRKPKLATGRGDDPLEHEADRVADEVMRAPTIEAAVTSAPPRIDRKCAEEEKREKNPTETAEGGVGEPARGVREVLQSPGEPLDDATRAYLEPRFMHDFSRVRVHSGPVAERSAREFNANAYTVGHDIVFGAGQFEPQTREGQRLIAHELTHVVQQGLGSVSSPSAAFGSVTLQRQPKTGAVQAPRTDKAPGLGPARTEVIEDLIKNGDFQGAVDTLVGYKYMDYEIDLNLLAGKKMTFDSGLTSDDAITSQLTWDFVNNKADPATVKIGPSAFSSVSFLYSVIMHEYQHVLWGQTLAHQQELKQLLSQGFGDPSEVEAGAWELLHAKETGMANLPDKIAQVWENLNKAFWKLDAKSQNSERPMVNRALSAAQSFVKGKQQLVPFAPP
jgi:hypothetical protein